MLNGGLLAASEELGGIVDSPESMECRSCSVQMRTEESSSREGVGGLYRSSRRAAVTQGATHIRGRLANASMEEVANERMPMSKVQDDQRQSAIPSITLPMTQCR